MSKHGGGAPGTAAATAVHPCLCYVFVILLSRVSGQARSAFCDGPKLRQGRNEFIYKIVKDVAVIMALWPHKAPSGWMDGLTGWMTGRMDG